MITLYHGTNNKALTEINNMGLFGGLFMSSDISAAESHGAEIYEVEMDETEIASSVDLESVKDFRGFFPWLDEDQFQAHDADIFH